MRKAIDKLVEVGISAMMTTEEKGLLKLSNRIAWYSVAFLGVLMVIGLSISEFQTALFNFSLIFVLIIPVVLNYLKKYSAAKLFLVFFGIFSIVSGSLLYGYDSVFKYLMVLPISVTFIFFSEGSKWKLYSPIGLIVLILGIFEFDKFYNQKFTIKNFNNAFVEQEYTGHIYESVTFVLLISIYILIQAYHRYILKKKENELLIYKKIFDNSQEGLAIVDKEYRYIKQNSAHEEILGMTGDEISGNTPAILMGEEALTNVKKVLNKTGKYSGELSNGKEIGVKHIDLMAFSIMEKNETLCHVGIIRDITKQKNLTLALETSEKRYRTLINLMGEGLGVVDENEIFLFVNPEIEKIFGVKPNSLEGRDLFEFLDSEQSQVVKIQSGLRKSGTLNSYKLIITTPNGEIKNIQVTAAPFINDGKVTGTIAVVIDITEREKNLNEIITSETNLKAVNATKDKLFSIIAHDLRSPFNGILGYSELLLDNVGKNEIAKNEKYLGIINSSAKKTLVLLDNLLNWAKSQTGQLEFNPEVLNLNQVIQEVISAAGSPAKIKDISLVFFQPEEIVVFADQNMLKTVLRNLISNAIKFTNTGGHIKVYATTGTDSIEITISDNGIGMDKESISKLFDLETSTSSVGTSNEKGSGLGLILCAEFVKKHGGEISVNSVRNKGSEFVFTLPVNTL